MQSPFPGMDPYLEQHWGDVHHNLISFAEGWLNERLPRDLRARAQERILVDLPSEERTNSWSLCRVRMRDWWRRNERILGPAQCSNR